MQPQPPETPAHSNQVLLEGMRALTKMLAETHPQPEPLPHTQSCRMAL